MSLFHSRFWWRRTQIVVASGDVTHKKSLHWCFPLSGLYGQVKCYKCCNLRRFRPQILSMVSLAARPFRKQMCQSALERRRSSSEVGKAGKSRAIFTGGSQQILWASLRKTGCFMMLPKWCEVQWFLPKESKRCISDIVEVMVIVTGLNVEKCIWKTEIIRLKLDPIFFLNWYRRVPAKTGKATFSPSLVPQCQRD